MKKADLVYEIGTEEIPAGYLPPAERQLRAEFEAFLDEANLSAESVETAATPRRIVLFARGLPDSQEDRTEEVTGPPWKAAFDKDGNATKAAEGFARGRGLTVNDLRQVETPKGPYVGATVKIMGRETIDLLGEKLPEITAKLAFPKTMKWGPERFRFARPIRWLLALFGERTVPFAIEGVSTGKLTYGNRILARGPFKAGSVSEYEAALAKGRVVLRADERARRIEAALDEAARSIGASVIPDPSLVREVSYLVETPSAFAGEFDDEFLELPAPVITTAMRDHQRYFAVADESGKLKANFLCVANSAPEAAPAVRNGNQRVLRARLDDARFYWNEDLKTSLEEKVGKLENVVWLEGFGSLRDKTERIVRLAGELAAGATAEVRGTVARAALISKSDLVTEMIKDGKEFTALQGVIGKEYARKQGEPEAVAVALEEQYRPRFAGDALPESEAGAYLAIADRLDTLVGVWAADMKPTGSKDPFALRRGSLGVIRILLERGMDRALVDLARSAAEGYGSKIGDVESVVREAADFMQDRLVVYLSEEEGFDADVVAAAAGRALGPVDARARAEALSALRSAAREDFEALAAGFKRARNILKKDSASGDPEERHLVEDAEKKLFEAYRSVDGLVAEAESAHRYGDAFTHLASLRGPIDAFFDSVLVMAEDDAVRKNRLRLLGRIVDRIHRLADLSRIALPEEAAR